MRSSIVGRNRQVLKSCEASTRRNFATNSARRPSLSGFVCLSCSRKLTESFNHGRTQRRRQSSTTSSQAASKTAPRINAMPPTHYELFPKTLSQGPPPSGPFHIDVRDLRKEFLQLQAVAHPDRHPSHLKARAEGMSAHINEAYKTLQNPLLRAQYLLRLRGVDVVEDETTKVEDPELLMEVLDAREEIDEAQKEEDLTTLKTTNDRRISRSEEILDKAFREDSMALATEEVVRLRYWVNIQDSLHHWENGEPILTHH
ncbi:hypothetical protein BJ875DRAFT_477667 [Amylocarpus encephaloides]|uniref:J domain-containing protein n=1 Tax=Amylocarpus encephaloides TaxID=45428 RepID=A0A9P8BZW3_9HELO|nr:hypothetical protein BJ875DRAFT_477667 [Amylocarpus encephaloides]